MRRSTWTARQALGCFAIAGLATAAHAGSQSINLAAVDNLYAIATLGTPVTGGGADGSGDAFPAEQLGTSLTWSGATYAFAAPGPHSAVSQQVIALPAAQDTSISFLATAVDGSQVNQTFVVTYTDGSQSTFTQSLSDWHAPQNYQGEAIALTTGYKITATGGQHDGAYHVYGYSVPINGAKKVKSFTLPNNPHVLVLSLDVGTGTSTSVSLSAVDNRYGIATVGSPVSGGVDGHGDAYSAALLGKSLAWGGATFSFAAPGPGSAASSTVIPLPAGQDSSISVLAAGVDGNQSNQTFVVTYSDGSKSAFTQSLSDWHTPQQYAGESVALATDYKVTAAGGEHSGAYYIYGYRFALNSAKTVASLTLPNNPDVVVLAVDLTPAGGSGGLPMAATPQIKPASGAYNAPLTVTLSDATAGATLYFTTDGSPPTEGSTKYTGPLTLNAGETIKAIAAANGYTDSTVASAAYTINPVTAAPPVISPSGGFYASATQVTLTTSTPNAAIYYTTDGTTPTIFSNRYNGPFTLALGTQTTINAFALADNPSTVTTAQYTLPLLPSEVIYPSDPSTMIYPAIFLFNNTAQMDSCNYYWQVGAITDCTMDSTGTFFVNGLTLSQWLATRFNPLVTAASPAASATFINVMDLNFTRDHHAATLNGASAAYVCNYKGPDFFRDVPAVMDQKAVDAAIASARNNVPAAKLPCVVFDYGVNVNATVGNGQPFMRFLVFNAAGNLIPTVDLDGRGQKTVPNACTACHGIPLGASAPVGYQGMSEPHYIPFDEGNFAFSSVLGLRQTDQESQIKALNLVVLGGQGANTQNGTGDGGAIHDLIHGWYDLYDSSGTDLCASNPADCLASPTQQLYAPAALIAAASGGNQAGLNEFGVYLDVYAPLCRSCHVANGVNYGGFPPVKPGDLLSIMQGGGVCSPVTQPSTFMQVMPNSKVSFDRLWTAAYGSTQVSPMETDYITLLQQLFNNGTTCALNGYNPLPGP